MILTRFTWFLWNPMAKRAQNQDLQIEVICLTFSLLLVAEEVLKCITKIRLHMNVNWWENVPGHHVIEKPAAQILPKRTRLSIQGKSAIFIQPSQFHMRIQSYIPW